MKFLTPQILALTAFAALPAMADYQGSLSFSTAEVARHYQALPRIMEVASECLQADLKHHQTFFRKWKVSPFYGDNSSFSKLSAAGRRDYLRKYKRYSEAEISFILETLQPTSCIGLTLKCLGEGFAAAGEDEVWERLKAYTKLNGVTGGALQVGLRKLGWKTLYWNPNTAKNEAWDAEEKRLYPDNPKKIWGYHAYNWATVNKKGKYLYNTVDDITTLVNFGENVPKAMKSVPFFVGIAHMGYHVFPGSYGQIIEGHSTRQLHDPQTVETSPFNPLADGGGPRGQYRSGLIAVPPGYVR